MDRQIVFERAGGAGGEARGIVSKQVLVIELSFSRQPAGNKDKVWCGLKELGSLEILRVREEVAVQLSGRRGVEGLY